MSNSNATDRTSALTPDDPTPPAEVLPETCDDCESTGYNCSLHADVQAVDEAEALYAAAPRSWSDGEIPADVEEVRTADGRVAHRHFDLWCFDQAEEDHALNELLADDQLFYKVGPVTEVLPSTDTPGGAE